MVALQISFYSPRKYISLILGAQLRFLNCRFVKVAVGFAMLQRSLSFFPVFDFCRVQLL